MANRINQELTTGEILFIEDYLSNGYNRKAAVKAANFKASNPSRYGTQVLTRPQVQEELKKRIEEKRKEFFLDEMDVKAALWEEANFRGKGSTQSGRIQAIIALGKTIGMFSADKGTQDSGKKGLVFNITNYGTESAKEVTGEIIEQMSDDDNTRRLEADDEDI